ncbi:MAG: UDP-N-acetylmuramoyl-L-alanyl-D-glutamate--2,6-diaminopimelate ligase [Ignavibacteriaceae bacterium]|jgi:UDP-N-acetylmuramoyl-L-alanyl-D-glutamate--2,6-diaminopimelate ligase
MELTQLLNSVKAIQVTGEVQRKDVSGIFYDSRKVLKSSVFIAVKGYKTDGHKFILDAINKGVIAVILEDNHSIPEEIFTHEKVARILVKDSRVAMAEISDSFFKHPSSNLKLIGITGTNGKTTISYFIKSILENSNEKTGLLGTIVNYIGDKEFKASLTTPESSDLNELLLGMVNEGCGYAIMEVSSHSLVLNRVYGLNFSAGIFTNITSDHLDFHQNFNNYFQAKKILFDSLSSSSFAIYNADDKSGLDLVKDCRAKLFSYGMLSGCDFLIKDIKFDLQGTSFKLVYNGNEFGLFTTLIGEFNAYNAAASFAAAVIHGVSEELAVEGIKKCKQVPGRMEVLGKGNKKAVIDYSHTADSLEKALLTIKKLVKVNQPVYTVFGCGGNRDKSKRPVMGKIACELSNHVIITSDNPRFENPFQIINEIKNGIEKNNFDVIENREEAIRFAIANSEDDAVILIAGKGHESYQEINGTRNHFSDKEIAEKYLL